MSAAVGGGLQYAGERFLVTSRWGPRVSGLGVRALLSIVLFLSILLAFTLSPPATSVFSGDWLDTVNALGMDVVNWAQSVLGGSRGLREKAIGSRALKYY